MFHVRSSLKRSLNISIYRRLKGECLMGANWRGELISELTERRDRAGWRQLHTVQEADQPWLQWEGRSLVNMASNNYLGLAGDDCLREAAMDAVKKYGTGATASRLIIGNHPLYDQAEQALRQWKEVEGGLILASGYNANLGLISTLVGRGDVVFSDRFN